MSKERWRITRKSEEKVRTAKARQKKTNARREARVGQGGGKEKKEYVAYHRCHIYKYTYMHTCLCIHIHIYTYTSTCLCIYIWDTYTPIYWYIHRYNCIYVYTCGLYTYMHIVYVYVYSTCMPRYENI